MYELNSIGETGDGWKIDNDWRIGQLCKPKYVSHSRRGKVGKVIATAPSGTNGIDSIGGVLKIQMANRAGDIVIDGADEWVTA